MESKPANPLNEDAACEECGNFGALEMGDGLSQLSAGLQNYSQIGMGIREAGGQNQGVSITGSGVLRPVQRQQGVERFVVELPVIETGFHIRYRVIR